MKIKTLRQAIAMIELIFAIVIIGLVLMSAPQLMQTAAKSGYITIQQEAINEAASQVNMIMGYYWDENTTDELYIDPVLHVSNGDGDLNESGTTGYRLGTPNNEGSRSFKRTGGNEEFNASIAFGNSADGDTQFDDIDDFDGNITSLKEMQISTADNIEKTTIRIETAISYMGDSPNSGTYSTPTSGTITYNPAFDTSVSGTTNIKSITVTLTSISGVDELNKTIELRAFSCNIGGHELATKY